MAEAICRQFEGVLLEDSKNQIGYTYRESDVFQGRDGNWWACIVPEGIDSNSEPVKVLPVVKELYSRLAHLGGFRFACVGWEVGGRDSYDEIIQDGLNGEDNLSLGLVVSQELLQSMGRLASFKKFGANTYWKPLTEKDFEWIASLW